MIKRNIYINYVGLLIMGTFGIFINIFILLFYSKEILGNFNFIFSFLVILSQFAVAGIQFSILKHNSHFYKKLSEVSHSLSSALLLTASLSLLVICMLYFSVTFIEKFFEIDNFSLSLYLVLPALFFFALNKILLMSINGLNYMQSYAVFNASRYVILLFFVLCFYFLKINSKFLTLVFTLTESFLFFGLSTFTYVVLLQFKLPKICWIKRHFYFGIRGMWGGALMEMNTRIDTIMIGAFLGSGAVGLYSFASMLAEGFAQVYIVLKTNIDPILGDAFFNKKSYLINDVVVKIRKQYVPYIIIIGVFSIVLYKPIFENFFGLDATLIGESWPIFNTLIFFYLLASFYRPFIGALGQLNKPWLFSQVIIVGALMNIFLNVFFLKLFGILGAAISTGLVFLFESFIMYHLSLKVINNATKRSIY